MRNGVMMNTEQEIMWNYSAAEYFNLLRNNWHYSDHEYIRLKIHKPELGDRGRHTNTGHMWH
jgi:hypothetical protein